MQTRTYLAIGSWLVFAVALCQQQTAVVKRVKQQTHLTVEQRIEQIQTGYQAALEDLSMTNLQIMQGRDENGNPVTIKRSPRFGFSRTPTASIKHDGVVRPTDVPTFAGIDEPAILCFGVSNLGKPLSKSSLQLQTNFGVMAGFVPNMPKSLKKDVVAFAAKSLPTLKAKNVYTGKIDDMDVQARPLRFSKPECMPCHTDSKQGDAAAILVYVVQKPVR